MRKVICLLFIYQVYDERYSICSLIIPSLLLERKCYLLSVVGHRVYQVRIGYPILSAVLITRKKLAKLSFDQFPFWSISQLKSVLFHF